MSLALAAGAIFFFAYALIVSELVHRTVAALLGGVAMILAGVVHQEMAFASIDWNVIFLLLGMMSIAGVLRQTGLFQWVAVQSVRLGKGDPFLILVILSLVTAVSSAFLDNVTIVVLIAPVTLIVANNLHISPIPFLIAEVLASNIGGTATLVGDPPNILIGSAADIDFLHFIEHMGPISLIILVVFVGMAWFLFRKDLEPASGGKPQLLSVDASQLITDRPLLYKSLIVMGGVIIGFLIHGFIHLQPATIALSGATVLLLWGKSDPHDIFQEVEWTTLLFFVGLFILVEGVVEVGLIAQVAHAAVAFTGGSLPLTSLLILWFSAVMSGIVDNIPYTATMIPVIQSLGDTMPTEALWWSLALGACLGGNATLVGASANVVVASLAERSGYSLKFGAFLRYGLVTTFVSLLLASAYIWLRYL
jgi:Na+/H+ antiporter NhaD/arsenite permease-like protein